MAKTDVLVAGAGPTGVTLALELARAGVAVRIVDKAAAPFAGSRGKGLSARSLEVLDDLGVIDEILASGFRHLPHRTYLRGVMNGDADPYADRVATPDMPYESGVIIPQWRTEEILRGRLAEFGVEVEQSAEVVGFEQSAESVTVELAGGERVEAAYFVGCDGGRSLVRKALGVGFEGESGPQGMLIGDVGVEGLAPDRWYQWVHPELGFVALCPFRGSRSWQFQGVPLTAFTEDGRLPEPTLPYLQEILDEVAGVDVKLSNATWLSTYRVNVRMVDSYRVGRVLLAGDAAHVHPPAGGLGMNTGIQDAHNLAWKLALVVRGDADESLVDTYQEERLPIAEWTLGVSAAGLKRVAETFGSKDARGLDAGATPDGHQLGLGYPWSSLSSDVGGPVAELRAGSRAPDAPVLDSAGSPVRLFDVFRGPAFTVLGFGLASAPALRELDERFTCAVVGESAAPGVDLVDDAGHARRAYGITEDAFVVVRPDGYVGLTAPVTEAKALAVYLAQFAA
jgi:2-polyprenyl-6-methoxyphenol hydroxylase-like FAD-dependent oxidoreductase